MADYGVSRLAATSATGQVTFARFSPTLAALIPLGALVQTADGTQTFAVVADASQAAYSASQGGYVVAAGTASVIATVQAQTTGTGGNVQAGTVTVLATGISGIDTVTNANPFTNALAAESDGALRTRFVSYISSLSKATKIALGNAISSVQQGLSYTLVEELDYPGTGDIGFFYVVVDDGSGSPPTALLNSVAAAIELVRPLGIRYGVFGPTVVTAALAMTLTTASGYSHSAVVAAVTTALQTTINSLPLGTSLPYTQLAAIAYGVAGVVNVTGMSINGGTADLTATSQQVVKTSTIAVV